ARSCAVTSAACSSPRRSAALAARRAEYVPTASAAPSTSATIAAVCKNTRPAIPGALIRIFSITVIPDHGVGSSKLVEVRRVDIGARVDDQPQRGQAPGGND